MVREFLCAQAVCCPSITMYWEVEQKVKMIGALRQTVYHGIPNLPLIIYVK